MNGEGHFLALFQKQGQPDMVQQPTALRPDPSTEKWLRLFFEEIGLTSLGGSPFQWNRVETRGDKVYYLPPVNSSFHGLTFLRNGLYLGDLKKNRFEPSQPFALALHKGDAQSVISLAVDDPRLIRYLKGETLLIQEGEAAAKRLASSLRRRPSSGIRQTGKRNSKKQISGRLEDLTSRRRIFVYCNRISFPRAKE